MVASGGPFKLGDELAGLGGFTLNSLSGWDLTEDDSLIAGQVTAIGLSLQGMSPTPLKNLKERLEQTKAKLEASDPTGLTGEHLGGDLLTACVWGYFASVELFGRTVQTQSDMIDLPGLSYGLLHAEVIPNRTFFGVTTSVRFPGLEMDIGHLRDVRIAKDGNRETWVRYNRMRGVHGSTMEATIPVKFFTDNSTNSGEGISATTVIAKAAQQGQKIFTITQLNQTVALPQLSHSEGVMENVRNALAQGMEVTISEQSVSSGNWAGAGYIITDPATGAGAYMIEGEANGGKLTKKEIAEELMWAIFFDGIFKLCPALLAIYILAIIFGPIVIYLAILIGGIYLIHQAHKLPEDNFFRELLVNMAFGAFSMVIGLITGSLYVFLISWIILSVLNVILSSRDSWIYYCHYKRLLSGSITI